MDSDLPDEEYCFSSFSFFLLLHIGIPAWWGDPLTTCTIDLIARFRYLPEELLKIKPSRISFLFLSINRSLALVLGIDEY